MKRLLIIVASIVGVLIVAALLVPLFINVDSFRPKLEKSLSTALNRDVHIGKLDASIFSGGASATQITISDDPAFNKGPFLKAGSLKVGLHLMPLIFSKRLEVTTIAVNQPDIVLLKNAAGKWNFSTMGASGNKPKQTTSDTSTPDVSVEKFEIVDGKIRVGESTGATAGKEHVYDKVNLTAKNISLTSAIPFTLTANTPGGGALKLDGQAGPIDSADAAKTPLDASISVEHADLATTGFIDPASGLAGVVDFNGKIKSDGKKLDSEGKAKASNLRVIKGGQPAKAPVALDYHTSYGLDSQAGTITSAIHTGNSTVSANGTMNTKGNDTLANLKIQGKGMSVDDVVTLLPAFGVVLPQGASLKGGNINMDMTAEGPLDRLVINGPLNITGTHLTGFDLASKLGSLAQFAGVKPSNDTLIQTVSSVLRVSPEGIKADNIVLDVPSMGNLTGNGVIASNNALDFKMVLKLSGQAANTLGSLTQVAGGAAGGLASHGIPFTITGTTQNPKFLPSIGGDLKSGLKDTLLGRLQGKQGQTGQTQKPDLQNALGGLLGGKKKKP
jgi:AsmA protein